jgi:hypothetical protein
MSTSSFPNDGDSNQPSAIHWDAGEDEQQLKFTIAFKQLGHHAPAWRTMIGDRRSDVTAVVDPTRLDPNAWVMIVSDRGTSGLGGPLLAGQRPPEGVSADFVQFLRNVGEPRDKILGGGTYGFGKAIFYNLSDCHAIVVDTRCATGPDERRLMGAALTDPIVTESQDYTGRHWWGIPNEVAPMPLTGAAASSASAQLGLPGFEGDETGTDVVVLLPDLRAIDTDDFDGLDTRASVDTAADRVVSAILWHLWPRLGSSKRSPEVAVSVSVEGKQVPIARPDEYAFLRPFVQALDAVEVGSETSIERKNVKDPGIVGSYRIQLCKPDPSGASPHRLLSSKPFTGPYHHVARMRQARLVVDYLECEPYPGSDFGYAGVFLASKLFDQCFADSEPPTHDKWETAGLPEKPRLVVRYAMSKLRSQVKDFLSDKAGSRSSDLAGLGKLSARLAPLIPFDGRTTGDHRGQSGGSGSAGGGSQGRSARARIVDGPKLTRRDGEVRMIATIKPPDAGHHRVRLTADPYVVLDNGQRENDPPSGAPVPRVLGWYDEYWRLLGTTDELVDPPISAPEGVLYLEISRIAEASIGLKIQTSEA